MAIKITPRAAQAATAATTNSNSGRSADPNRAVLTAEDQLRNLLNRAEIAFTRTTFSSVKSLTALNKAIEKVTRQFELREHIRRRTPTAAGLDIDAELRKRINSISAKGTTAGFISSALKSAKIRGEISEHAAREYEQAQTKRQKERLKLEQQLIRQDQQNFKLGKAGKVQSLGLTSMSPLPAGQADKYIKIETEKALAIRRANYMGGGMIGGGGAGGRGGGGGWWSGNNLPVPARYPNLPSDRAYAGVPQRQTGEVGPYTGQMIHPRPMMRTLGNGGGGGGGFPWGKFAAETLGGPAAVAIGALEAGKELLTMSQTLATQMRPTLAPYDALFKAAQMTGGTVGGLQNLFSAGRGGLGVSDALARWGYHSDEDAAAAYGTYGGKYRPMATFAAATQLGQGPNTAFMGNEDWNRQLGRWTGAGMGLSGGGSVEQTKKMLTDAFAAGAEKGMPSPEMWESMNKVLNAMLGTGMAFNPGTFKMMTDMTNYGAGSAVPGMRNGTYQAQAMQSWSEAAKNPMGGTGLYATTLLSEAKRLEGTTDLSAKQWQDLITKEGSTYKMDTETAKDIDAMRASGKFKGAFGMLTAEKLLANRGLPADVLEKMYYASAARQLGITDPRAAAAFSTAFGAPAGAMPYEFNRGALGTPPTSAAAPFTVMSAHGKRTPFTAGGRADSFGMGPPPAGVAPGTSAGEARIVDASATAAKLAVANFELDTLGRVTDSLNRSFTNLFTYIDKWVGGAPAGKPTGPSA